MSNQELEDSLFEEYWKGEGFHDAAKVGALYQGFSKDQEVKKATKPIWLAGFRKALEMAGVL